MKAAKWVFALCGLSLLVLVSQARATTTVTVDGSWWASHSAQDRFLIVEGIIEGEATGAHYLALPICMGDLKNDKKFAHCVGVWNVNFSKKFVVYMNYVSNFYANYPDASGVRVSAIVWCHQNGMDPNHAAKCESSLVKEQKKDQD